MSRDVDLLCGRDSSDPSTLYRITEELREGGQAMVYRGRGPGPDSRREVTLRVWKWDEDSPADVFQQQTSWARGDRVLSALVGRVPNVCNRIDSFIGFAPWWPGGGPSGQPIPIQVLEYVPGVDLRLRLSVNHLDRDPDLAPIDGTALLQELAATLCALSAAGSIIHQDIRPSNIVIGPQNEMTLIDFTSARSVDDVTSIAVAPRQHAPEVRRGNLPNAKYDVHGFGVVAYYLVVREFPRNDACELQISPTLDRYPALRAHLLQVLDDDPDRRPEPERLDAWVTALARLVHAEGFTARGVFWPTHVDEFRSVDEVTETLYALPRPPRRAAAVTSLPMLAVVEVPAAVSQPDPPPQPRVGGRRPVFDVGLAPVVPLQATGDRTRPIDYTPVAPVPAEPTPTRIQPAPGRRSGLSRLLVGAEVTALPAIAVLVLLLGWALVRPDGSSPVLVGFLAAFLPAAALLVITHTLGLAVLERLRSEPLSVWHYRALHAPGAVTLVLTALVLWLNIT